MKEYRNYINGKWVKSASRKTFSDINPADNQEIIGHFQQSSIEDLEMAIQGANYAYKEWRRYPFLKREGIFQKAVSIFEKNLEDLAHDLTQEEGKTLNESRQEILSGIKEMKFQIGQARHFFGKTSYLDKEKASSFILRQPIGVCLIISPWNFPFNVPCRKITPALLAGNTVLFKPASFTPLTGLRFVEVFIEAGMPKGVLNFVTGSGSIIGERMAQDSCIKAISFTGSTETGKKINELASKNMIKTQLEMGGKNPMVILEDADLGLAIKDAILAAYSCSGQWCTSTSRVIVVKEISKKFIEGVVSKVKDIKVGNGLEKKTNMGPLAGESQLKRVLEYIAVGKKQGAKLIFGGKRLKGLKYDKGFFIEPTIFSDVKPDMRIAQEEIFGPVLSIVEADNFFQALSIANEVEYGLSSSIYTKDISRAMEFIHRSEVGLTHVNFPTSFKEPQLPFGGIKSSGYGLPEAGETGIQFFTEIKSVYINY
jgi:aldehyde dehydrogenase (NAD+)